MARSYNIDEVFPRAIIDDGTDSGSRPGVSRVVAIDASGTYTTVWTPASKSTQDDFEDGDLAEYDRTDGWSTTASPTYEGSSAVGNSPSSEEYLVALEGSLPVDFAPGDVWHVPVYFLANSCEVYWGDQDTTNSDQYELSLREDGSLDVFKNESGTDTKLRNVSATSVQANLDNNWIHIFIEWDPGLYSGNYDPDDSDDSHTGDFLVTVTDDDGIPVVQAFVDANDTTFRSGGIAMVLKGGEEGYYDKLEVGDRAAFDLYSPNRPHEPDEIDTWNNWRMEDWVNDTDKFRLAGEPEITPAVGEFCLANDAGFGFSRIGAVQGNGFPNLLPDGGKARLYVQSDALDGLQGVLGAYADSSNWSRLELRRGEDRIRVVDNVSGSKTVHADIGSVGLSADVWREITVDRSDSGTIRFVMADGSGGTHIDHTHTLDGSLANNPGVAVQGSSNDTATFYFDDFRQE